MSRYTAVAGRESDPDRATTGSSRDLSASDAELEMEAAFDDDSQAHYASHTLGGHGELQGAQTVLFDRTSHLASSVEELGRNSHSLDHQIHPDTPDTRNHSMSVTEPYSLSTPSADSTPLIAQMSPASQPSLQHNSHEQIRFNPHDGVFANLSAKPDRPSDIIAKNEEKHPPSYEQAAADATPPYWETTVVTNGLDGNGSGAYPFGSGPDDPIVDGLPVGNVFAFVWNLLVSMSFQFVGFLLTHLLHTTHAAKQGSRAGLGITLIQYGYYLRGKQPSEDLDGAEELPQIPEPDEILPASSLERRYADRQAGKRRRMITSRVSKSQASRREERVRNAFNVRAAQHDDSDLIPTAGQLDESMIRSQSSGIPRQTVSSYMIRDTSLQNRYHPHIARDGQSGASTTFEAQDKQSLTATSPEVLAFILMILGWIILLRSLLEYWRVRKMGNVLLMNSNTSDEPATSIWTRMRALSSIQRLRFSNDPH